MSTEHDDEPIEPDLLAFLDEEGAAAGASRSLLRQPLNAPAGLMESHLATAMAEFDRLHAPVIAPAQHPARSARSARWQRWLFPAFGLAAVAGLAVAVVTRGSNDDAGLVASAPTSTITAVASDSTGQLAAPGATIDSTTTRMSPDTGLEAVPFNTANTVTDLGVGGAPPGVASDPMIESAGAPIAPNLTSDEALLSFVRSSARAKSAAFAAPTCPDVPGELLSAVQWFGQPAQVYLTVAADGSESAIVVDMGCVVVTTVAIGQP
jgi:hypothetical protein